MMCQERQLPHNMLACSRTFFVNFSGHRPCPTLIAREFLCMELKDGTGQPWQFPADLASGTARRKLPKGQYASGGSSGTARLRATAKTARVSASQPCHFFHTSFKGGFASLLRAWMFSKHRRAKSYPAGRPGSEYSTARESRALHCPRSSFWFIRRSFSMYHWS